MVKAKRAISGEDNGTQDWALPGNRLVHILDKIRFARGYGRISRFHQYLAETDPTNFGDVGYSTVKSWFRTHVPSMDRIDNVFAALESRYSFPADPALVKTWWKIGGYYPFDAETEKRSLEKDKAEFKATSMIMSVIEQEFEDFSANDLFEIRSQAMNFIQDFGDPAKSVPDDEHQRIFILGIIESRRKRKPE